MNQDLPISIYNKEGQDIIKLDDLMVFLGHRRELKEREYISIQADSQSNLIIKSQIGGELALLNEILRKPEYIFNEVKKNGTKTI